MHIALGIHRYGGIQACISTTVHCCRYPGAGTIRGILKVMVRIILITDVYLSQCVHRYGCIPAYISTTVHRRRCPGAGPIRGILEIAIPLIADVYLT